MSIIAKLYIWLSLLAVGFTTSCSKKEEDPVPAVAVANYVRDGKKIMCMAKFMRQDSPAYDYLVIQLVTTPQPAAGPETLQLVFRKIANAPESTYASSPGNSLALYLNNSPSYEYNYSATTESISSDGTVSGTFTGEARYYDASGTYTVYSTITAGFFNNVRP